MSLLVFYSHYDSLLHLTEYRHKDSVPKLAVITVSLLVMFPGVDMNHPEMQIITRELLSTDVLGRSSLGHGFPTQRRVVHHVHLGGLHHPPGVPDLVDAVSAKRKHHNFPLKAVKSAYFLCM